MAETLIVLVPGEERLIRIRCGAPAAVNGEIEEGEIVEPPAGAANGEMGPAGAAAPNPNNFSNLPRLIEPSRNPRKSRKQRKNEGATRKNRKQSGGNGYMNFAKQERPKVLSQHPELKSNVVAVARKIGEAWRKLPEAERKKY
jgi:hypothetical protein